MALTNFTEGHIVKYANQVGLINSTCNKTEYSIQLYDGSEINSNPTELEGISLSKEMLEIMGFKHYYDTIYTPKFLLECKKSESVYDYPQLSLDCYDGKMVATVFCHKTGSARDKNIHHFIYHLHELQEIYRNYGYTIPLSMQMLYEIQRSIQ